MKLITRPRIRQLTLAFIGAGVLATATAGLASADAAGPTTPVPGTNCTVAQAENTLAAQNPAIYQKIMQYPDSAQGLADALALSPSDRADHWQKSTSSTPTIARSSSACTVGPKRSAMPQKPPLIRPQRPAERDSPDVGHDHDGHGLLMATSKGGTPKLGIPPLLARSLMRFRCAISRWRMACRRA